MLHNTAVWDTMEEQESRIATGLFESLHAPAEIVLTAGLWQALFYLIFQLSVLLLINHYVHRQQFKSEDRRMFTDQVQKLATAHNKQSEKTLVLLRRWSGEFVEQLRQETRKLRNSNAQTRKTGLVNKYYEEFSDMLDGTTEKYDKLLDNFVSTNRNQAHQFHNDLKNTIHNFDISTRRQEAIADASAQTRKTSVSVDYDFYAELEKMRHDRVHLLLKENLKEYSLLAGALIFTGLFVQWFVARQTGFYFLNPELMRPVWIPFVSFLLAIGFLLIWRRVYKYDLLRKKLHHNISKTFNAVARFSDSPGLDLLIRDTTARPLLEARHAEDRNVGGIKKVANKFRRARKKVATGTTRIATTTKRKAALFAAATANMVKKAGRTEEFGPQITEELEDPIFPSPTLEIEPDELEVEPAVAPERVTDPDETSVAQPVHEPFVPTMSLDNLTIEVTDGEVVEEEPSQMDHLGISIDPAANPYFLPLGPTVEESSEEE